MISRQRGGIMHNDSISDPLNELLLKDSASYERLLQKSINRKKREVTREPSRHAWRDDYEALCRESQKVKLFIVLKM